MKNKIIKLFVLSFSVVILLTQCKKEEIDIVDCNGVTATYSSNVKAILDANCAKSGCHNASSKKGGYELSSYDGSKSAGAKTAFLGSVQHKSGYSNMPKGASKLSDADIKTISCWVQSGMPN